MYTPRAGHAGVVVDDCLYVFGGSTLNTLLSDVVRFCVRRDSSWQSVARSSPWPAARHGHTMAALNSSLIALYGGVTDASGSSVSSELWLFSIAVGSWQLVTVAADRYDMTILMCAQKLTDASLIYHTGPKN